jgi:hypothetical protein
MGGKPDKKDDQKELDWLKDVTFPKGKEKPSDALWNAFKSPGWDSILHLFDVTGVDQVERGLKRIYGKAIDQTRQDIERTESDPLLKQTALDDLSAMKGEMERRTTFAFKSIFSLGDLPNLEKPIPPLNLKLAMEKKTGQTERHAQLSGPESEMIFDTKYSFFKTPKFKIDVGGVEKAFKSGKASDLSLKKVELSWRIAEATTYEKPTSKPHEPEPEEEVPPSTGEHVATGSKIFQRSALDLSLSANDLGDQKKGHRPYLSLDAGYDLHIGSRTLIRLGLDKQFGAKDDLKLTFSAGIAFP